jgi:hypothetical protein
MIWSSQSYVAAGLVDLTFNTVQYRPIYRIFGIPNPVLLSSDGSHYCGTVVSPLDGTVVCVPGGL